MPPEAPERYRFDLYEYVASTGYLYRKGHPVRLSEQQGRLLGALLQKAGEVVSPAEIRAVLWPAGEHLDHNHAIRNAINQLRSILRDKPQNPRFIETLPKRGYRFVAPVSAASTAAQDEIVMPSIVEPADRPSIPETSPAAISGLEPVASPSPQHSVVVPPVAADLVSASPSVWSRRRFWLFAAVLVLLLSSAALWFLRSRPRGVAAGAAPVTVGIAPIDASGPAAVQIAEPFRMELMDAIAQLPGVEVRATHSFPSDPAGMSNLHAVAQKLQLDALLLGRIEAADPYRLHIFFELVRGSDAVHLASFHYISTPGQLSATRDHIQRDLFYRLSSVSSQRLKPVRSTENSEAYSQYLSGRAQLIRHDDASIQQAIRYFRKAVELDPHFAQAWSGLGNAYLLTGEHLPADRESVYAQSRSAALKAISLNPDLGEAHATLGFLDFRHDWNAAASEVEFRRAIELDPNQAMHRIMYALLLCNTGRNAEAFEQISRAHDADPLWPPIYITEMYVAAAAGKNDLALDSARKLLDLLPDWPLAHDQSAWAYWYAGRHAEAIEEWIRMASLEGDQRRLSLERRGLAILKEKGVAAYSRFKLQAIEHPNGPAWNHPNDFQLAEWQINAGQREAALTSMRQMVREHDPEVLQFAASPAYLSLHKDPGFQKLLTSVGLPR